MQDQTLLCLYWTDRQQLSSVLLCTLPSSSSSSPSPRWRPSAAVFDSDSPDLAVCLRSISEMSSVLFLSLTLNQSVGCLSHGQIFCRNTVPHQHCSFIYLTAPFHTYIGFITNSLHWVLFFLKLDFIIQLLCCVNKYKLFFFHFRGHNIWTQRLQGGYMLAKLMSSFRSCYVVFGLSVGESEIVLLWFCTVDHHAADEELLSDSGGTAEDSTEFYWIIWSVAFPDVFPPSVCDLMLFLSNCSHPKTDLWMISGF